MCAAEIDARNHSAGRCLASSPRPCRNCVANRGDRALNRGSGRRQNRSKTAEKRANLARLPVGWCQPLGAHKKMQRQGLLTLNRALNERGQERGFLPEPTRRASRRGADQTTKVRSAKASNHPSGTGLLGLQPAPSQALSEITVIPMWCGSARRSLPNRGIRMQCPSRPRRQGRIGSAERDGCDSDY